jgi:membrane-bound lytic murein transglycosylase D
MFMSMARRIFREEGIPENVAWLGQVESTWKPTALSWAAASGLWQFIPGTGARYGLRRTAHVDERNSFDEATRASARYLKFLFNRYGNWELAMAGYNCGEGNVDRAIARSGQRNFWAAYPFLPRETRNYVPNILATILIANNPTQYGFGHVRPAPPLRYDRIRVPASTNLSILAQASDTSVQYIRYLNPHLRSNVTPPEPYIINVPAGKANDVVAVFKRLPASKINNTSLANSVTGETWQTVSNRTGVSVADLMAANPGMKEPKGKVFVPVSGNKINTIAYSRPSSQTTAGAKPAQVVKAVAGDTVAKLAVRHKADPVEVAKYNGLLPNSVLGAGREIKLPVKQ